MITSIPIARVTALACTACGSPTLADQAYCPSCQRAIDDGQFIVDPDLTFHAHIPSHILSAARALDRRSRVNLDDLPAERFTVRNGEVVERRAA